MIVRGHITEKKIILLAKTITRALLIINIYIYKKKSRRTYVHEFRYSKWYYFLNGANSLEKYIKKKNPGCKNNNSRI